jgi:hypothetical protein
MTANPRTNTPRPRTVTVTEQDVRRLAAIIYHDTVLLTQAFEFSPTRRRRKRLQSLFLRSITSSTLMNVATTTKDTSRATACRLSRV